MRSRLSLAILVPFFATALSSGLLAQGSDACANPQSIQGFGTFPFDTRAATTGSEGQGHGACFAFATAGIDRDVWFAWTAPQDGPVTLATCGGTGLDSRIALHAGAGCPSGPPLACNDDACGYQSRIDFFALAGGVYTIQLGSFPGAAGEGGTFSLGAAAGFPGCLSGRPGPDLVLGDLLNVFNAAAEGPIDALALGGTACNVGSAPLDWFGDAGRSPVIRQNLFRYEVVDGAGRFEQVGLSWLKHGFFAVQENYCCTCQAEPGNEQLGVGCSDTYVAGINAVQAFLTPNWEVNAHTGEFPDPPSNPPWAGSVARRLQVAIADLEATGAGSSTRYFGEGLYVARDDAAAGNQDDNASWRELSVSGGPRDFDFDVHPSGHTERGRAAIEAWRKIDPAVRSAEVRVPGDGRLILCWRVTALDGGTWRYEYALYNMNADRSVGSFSVALPAGAAVAGVGFHDVAYHSGDGPGDVDLSGADWTAQQSGGALTWRTETEAQNPSANALRWGTLYNFRFDAPRPPRPATATLGLWKSGDPARFSVEVEGPADFLLEDACAGDGSLAACPCSNDGAPDHGCANSASASGARLAWEGSASLSADDLVLTSAGGPSQSLSIFLQGDQEISPTIFGDGLRCTDGNLKRLYVRNATAGTVRAPEGSDPSISARSAALGDPIPPNATRFYQVLYRDPVPGFCPDPPGSTFNASNGVRAIWGL